MEIVVHNAYIFYCQQSNSKKKTLREFSEDVIQYILGGNPDVADCRLQPFTATTALEKTVLHYLDHIPPTRKKSNPTRQCRVCTKKKIRRETRYYCPTCRYKPPLCVGNCYRKYHEETNI